MNFLIKNTYYLVAFVVFLYLIYFLYTTITGNDPFAPQVQFFVNIATLVGILAVLEERKEKKNKNYN